MKRARPAQRNVWPVVYGVLGVGALYYLWKSVASAAPASSTAGILGVPGASGTSYSVAALNASVPGVTFAPSTLDPSILTSTLTAVPAVTAAQVASANTFWTGLMPVNPPPGGYITFPSGSQAAAALFTGGNTRMDSSGNLYVQWAGQVYQLPLYADSSGNWPARLVTGN